LTRAIRTRDWRLIRVLHPGLYPLDDEWMLYKAGIDPGEVRNVASENPKVVETLKGQMEAWREEQLRKNGMGDALEEMIAVGPFLYYSPEQMMNRLLSTGREAYAKELQGRLSRFGVVIKS